MAHAPAPEQPGIKGWIEYRLPIFGLLDSTLVSYPTPRNLNYFWNFGSIAGLCLVAQIMTGIFLAMNYAANTGVAFDSVEHIMRDVNYGWLLRYMHATGASMFFIVTYVHIFRGLYYGSYKRPRELLWLIGVGILLIMMATAFMGYVLPWGQMSFWGATVITNLFSAFPLVGDPIVTWLWGGFSVDNPTLNRFYALHFLLPFVLVGVVVLHLVALHTHGSSNPTGIDANGPQDKIPFHPYYTSKDFFGFGVFFMVFAAFVFFAPNYLGHPDNYTPANPMVTPPHIVPEWYFLPFYAILRAIVFDIPLYVPGLILVGGACAVAYSKLVDNTLTANLKIKLLGAVGLGFILLLTGLSGAIIPSKLGGVCAMFGAIAVLAAMPWLDTSPVRSANYRPIYKWLFWALALDGVLLGYVGSQTPDWGVILDWQNDLPWLYRYIDWIPNITIGLLATAYYFIHFLVLVPVVGKREMPLPLPTSIGVAVKPQTHAHH